MAVEVLVECLYDRSVPVKLVGSRPIGSARYEAIVGAGPTCSVAASAADVDQVVTVLAELTA